MKTSAPVLSRFASIVAVISLGLSHAFAEVREFTIDSTQSVLTVGGSFVGIPFQEQGPGSLTTRFGGKIRVDITAGAIQFVGGSVIVASNSGNWEPAPGGASGVAPANYGTQGNIGLVVGKAAVRNIVLDLTSEPLAISGQAFAAESLVFQFPDDASSAFDYTYSGFANGSGSEPLAGNSTNNVGTTATLLTQGSVQKLTIPVSFDGFATVSTENDVRITLEGQLVATAPSTEPGLEIGTVELSQGQLHLTFPTMVGQIYVIESSTDLRVWPTVVDQFMATNSTTTRSIVVIPELPRDFFRVRQN